MHTVGILVHPSRSVRNAVDVVARWAADHSLEFVQIPSGEQPRVAPPGEVGHCDLVVAVGGDGTVLKGLHAAASSGTPVLGVAYGSLGALSAVPQTELRVGLDRFAAGDWVADELPALEVGTDEGFHAWGINDVVVARRGGTQLIVEVFVEDDLYVRLAGDGVIVATPLGSSAYSMAAGGPLLTHNTSAFVCTPLAMHGGCAPPLVVPGECAMRLVVSPGYGGYEVAIDGFQIEHEGDHIWVRSARSYATLVELERPRAGIPRLRERGLIADSPRVIARGGRAHPEGAN